jgi:hypothetical protein
VFVRVWPYWETMMKFGRLGVGAKILAFDEARKKGWTVISMKNDWKKVFAFDAN